MSCASRVLLCRSAGGSLGCAKRGIPTPTRNVVAVGVCRISLYALECRKEIGAPFGMCTERARLLSLVLSPSVCRVSAITAG